MKSFVVSIHDVSPLTRATTEKMLGELRAHGVNRTSLLVIPNHHHRGHFLDDPDFCEWLHEEETRGCEIVLHGYFHLREKKPAESAAEKFMTRVYTQNEGEFFDISETEALEKIKEAHREFAEAGFAPSGFIAPAWLLSEAGERAAIQAGCEYTTRLTTVLDLKNGHAHHSQSLVYSVQTGWRRTASLAWNAWLFRRLAKNKLMRLGLHPPDFAHPKIWQQIRHHAAQALKERECMTYADWIRNERNAAKCSKKDHG